MQESQEDEVVVFAKPPPPDLKCSICLELFRDPLITNCGHTFCSRCVYQVSGGASGDQCAVCRKSVVVTELSPNLLAKSLVDEQLVHCRYGCVWTEEVGWVVDEGACEEILKIGDRYNHEQDCEYQPVVCPFNPDRCEVMYKFELEEHLEVCPYNKVDGAKTAQMEQRRRERTDTFNLFTYMTIWVFFVYFLYSSHTFGSQIRHASPALLSLFSLPVCFILAIAVYETSRADASQADVE